MVSSYLGLKEHLRMQVGLSSGGTVSPVKHTFKNSLDEEDSSSAKVGGTLPGTELACPEKAVGRMGGPCLIYEK